MQEMSHLSTELQKRIKEAEEEISSIQQRMNPLRDRLSKLEQKVKAFRAALDAETESSDGERSNAAPRSPTFTEAAGAAGRAVLDAGRVTGQVLGEISKTQFVRELIKAYGGKGISPTEIKTAAEQRNLDVGKNFPYAEAGRLKAQGEIKQEEGKYFPESRTN